MRQKSLSQLPLTYQVSENYRTKLLMKISSFLSDNPTLTDEIQQALTRGKKNTGANGITSEQVLRIALLRAIEGFTYDDLVFHLNENLTYRAFCLFGISDSIPSRSSLAALVKLIPACVWESINTRLLLTKAAVHLDSGDQIRTDCTVVQANIHEPTDSSLLYDLIRVTVRTLKKAGYRKVPNRRKAAKRRLNSIRSCRRKKERRKLYRKLLSYTYETMGYACTAFEDAVAKPGDYPDSFATEIALLIIRGEILISQTERRVFAGEKVPSTEKLVSIFEPHTDIIVKDNRDTFYGHKICLSAGKSSLVFDCTVLEGNPADSTLTIDAVRRLKEKYGSAPVKVAMDGGFASKKNLKTLKAEVDDVCFSKKRGMKEEDMCASTGVYKALWKFRAGVEGIISWLKRSFSLSKCPWRSFPSFRSYVWNGIVAANLVTLCKSLM